MTDPNKIKDVANHPHLSINNENSSCQKFRLKCSHLLFSWFSCRYQPNKRRHFFIRQSLKSATSLITNAIFLECFRWSTNWNTNNKSGSQWWLCYWPYKWSSHHTPTTASWSTPDKPTPRKEIKEEKEYNERSELK